MLDTHARIHGGMLIQLPRPDFFFISKNQKADKKSLYFVKIWRLTKECVCPPPFFLPNVLILVDLKS